MTETKLEDTELYKKTKAYNEKWEKERVEREKEDRERKEQSIFEDTSPCDGEHKERGLLTHPINPLSERHPHHKSLTLWQYERIEKYLRAGLSIRATMKAVHADGFNTSFGVIKTIRKKITESN